MTSLRAHPVYVTLGATLIAAITTVAIAGAYGFGAFAKAWTSPHFAWLALAICAELLSVAAYAVAYRVLSRLEGGPRLGVSLVVRVVIAGFGPFAPGGGFALDKRAMRALEGDEDVATVRVLGMGSLEWAVLAPAACATAVALLAAGNRRVMPSVLWPWAIAVPVGFAVALWFAVPARRERLFSGQQGWRGFVDSALLGVGVLGLLARGISRNWLAWGGMAAYWALDIAAFYGSCRFVGMRLSVGEAIIAYATGYALTRRSMPLAGAGITEALLTFSLHWAGQPVVAALVSVIVYRILNFALPAAPALLVRRRINPLLSAADAGRPATQGERRHAAAPLGEPRE